MSLVVIFAVGQEAAADTYLDFVNDPANCPDVPFYDERVDRYGQRVVAYLGPGGFIWNSQPFPEPEGGVEARSVGVLQEGYDAIIDPEED
jgi:hypothetical protein